MWVFEMDTHRFQSLTEVSASDAFSPYAPSCPRERAGGASVPPFCTDFHLDFSQFHFMVTYV
jgi:hypothetical protein